MSNFDHWMLRIVVTLVVVFLGILVAAAALSVYNTELKKSFCTPETAKSEEVKK